MKSKSLVIDTGALLKNVQLWEHGEELYTIEEVISELRDKRAKEHLLAFPVEIKRRQPQPCYIKQINEVSKKTGDYASLSLFDIKVLALTLELEVEAKGGSDHLEFDPKRPVTCLGGKNTSERLEGFYSARSEVISVPQEDKKSEGWRTPSDECDGDQSVVADEEDTDDEYHSLDDSDDKDYPSERLPDPVEGMLEELSVGDHSSGSSENSGDEDVQEQEQSDVDEEEEEENKDDDDDDDDDEGWITPSNLSKTKQARNENTLNGSMEEPDEFADVACITSDFAMQNVLKHMRLSVMSVDGKYIQQLRSYILRCFACRTTTSVMSKIFCPKCGNKTLKRVAVTVNPDGSQKIWVSTRRPINTKGMRFSLPTPKGGKHSSYPMLVEDQRFPQQRSTKKGLKKTNPLDPDYDAGDSPFTTRDIYSRAGQLGLVGGKQQGLHYWERRNPNVPLKSKGKKKRNKL